MRFLFVFFLTCALSLHPAAAGAQVAAGTLTGVIRDQAGDPIPRAAITATETATNATRTTITTSSGVYTLTGLPPGAYRVQADILGFGQARREGVGVETGQTVRLDLEMAIGTLQAEVTVTAGGAVLRRETATLGGVVESKRIVGLPLNGRSFITLATLTPGVALPPGSLLPRINGGRPRVNEYLFDGISVLQPEPGQVAYFP